MADEIVESSVQQKPTHKETSVVLRFLTLYNREMPDWWSPQRDAFFRDFWTDEPILASAIYSIAARNAAFGWDLSGLSEDVLWAQQLLQGSDFGGGWQQLITKTTTDLLTCLAARSTVMLGGDRRGQRKSVYHMVNDKDEGPVLSVDKDGSIVEKRVIGWHKSPLGNRRWMWIRAKYSSFHSGKRPGGMHLTNDHLVNTVNGWVRADQLNPGDKILTGYPSPNKKQVQLITGTMLGDASMNMKHGRSSAMLRFTHCEEQKEWINLKTSSLSGFGWTPKNTHVNKEFNSVYLQLNSHCTPGLSDIFDQWHADKKKHVPFDVVRENFSPLMLAAWYMDDGSLQQNLSSNGNRVRPGISLYTNGFDPEESDELANILTENGFEAKTYTYYATARNKHYTMIHLGADGAEVFLKYIAAYVPPTMRYKLPEDIYELDQYDPALWDLGSANTFVDEVETIVYKDHTASGKTVQTAYCLDVEGTHNFSVCGINVHNCDNGSFWEVIRPAKVMIDGLALPAVKQYYENNTEAEWFGIGSDGKRMRLNGSDYKLYDTPLDLPIGIAHLDSARVQRTGDPEVPAIYTDIDGKMHAMRWWQILMFADMPSPIEEMNGVGTSAMSRVYRNAHTLQSLGVYKDEKLSGRFTRAVHLTNADPGLIQDQIKFAQDSATNVGLQRYSQPVIASTFDPSATPTIATIDLASMPDNFEESTTMEWYIAVLALSLGVDYGFLAPLPGKGLGTASQSETMARQSRGKSSRLFMDMTANAINFRGILPESVRFKYIERDPQQELAEESVKKARAETRQIMIKSGEISPQISRQISADDGDLRLKYLDAMGESDLTPGIEVEGDVNLEAVNTEVEAATSAGSLVLPAAPIEQAEAVPQPTESAIASLGKGYSFDKKAIQARRNYLFKTPTLVNKVLDAARHAVGKKQTQEIEEALDLYEGELNDLVLSANDGVIDAGALATMLVSLAGTTLLAMFIQALGQSGAQNKTINEIVQRNEDAAERLAQDIADGRYIGREDILLRRMSLWLGDAYLAYNLGLVNREGNAEERFIFINGPTSDHCADCLRLDGQVHTGSEWSSHPDMLPQSRDLACSGYRCLCKLESTDESTNGNF